MSSPSTVFQPIDLSQVTLSGEFGRRVERIIEANILKIDVDDTFLNAFRKGFDLKEWPHGAYTGFGKFVDAVVRLAAGTQDKRLLALKERLIGELLATREPSGYIGFFKDPEIRVSGLYDLHESAYIIWALVSDYRFFSQERSLEAARGMADYIIARFKAHPGLRLDNPYDITFMVSNCGWDRALLALSGATGEAKYRDFAIEQMKLDSFEPVMVCGTTDYANHAYTNLSHCVAQLDLYRQCPDPKLLRSSHKLLDFLRRGDAMLVTGTVSQWECWHDTQSGLDNCSETCAGAYLARFMEGMLQIEGESLYGDILERDIYNALFAATAPDGSKSRYHTPFEGKRPYDAMGYRWCCANNNKRFLADLRGWMYYRTKEGVAVNLYNASTATVDLDSGITVRLEQQTDYPTSGLVRLKVDPSRDGRFEVKLRIPRWCHTATVSVNGSAVARTAGGQFYGLTREWRKGDVITLEMPMEWRAVRGRKVQTGRAAILRGPVLFTFNPERNGKLTETPDFEPRLLKVNPLEISAPEKDDSIRPGGISCQISGWLPRVQPWANVPREPVVLTEYPDPGGQAVYFTVPGEGIPMLTEDELI